MHNNRFGDQLLLNKAIFVSLFACTLLLGCATGSPSGAFCLTCSVDIVSLTSDGGEIGADSFSESDKEKGRQLANANCQYRGLGVAVMGESGQSGLVWRAYYPYRCVRPQLNPNYSAPTNAIPSGGDLTAAKDKCKELGFKQGTEAFGNCVLKLSK